VEKSYPRPFHRSPRAWKSRKRRGLPTFPQRRRRLDYSHPRTDPPKPQKPNPSKIKGPVGFSCRAHFRDFLAQQIRYPRRNRHYSVSQILLALVYPIVLGLDRIETASLLRANGSFQYLTGLPSFPDPQTLRRFLLNAPVHLREQDVTTVLSRSKRRRERCSGKWMNLCSRRSLARCNCRGTRFASKTNTQGGAGLLLLNHAVPPATTQPCRKHTKNAHGSSARRA